MNRSEWFWPSGLILGTGNTSLADPAWDPFLLFGIAQAREGGGVGWGVGVGRAVERLDS